MKILLMFLFAILFTVSTKAQNLVIKDNVSYQTKFQFDSPLIKSSAIAQFTSDKLTQKGYTFEPKVASVDDLGVEHQRHQEFYQGIKVEFGTLITHSKNNYTFYINAEIYNVGAINLAPALSKNDAFERVLLLKPDASFLWNDIEQSKLLGYQKPDAELVILPNVKTGFVNLAYKFDIYTSQPVSRNYIYIDANNGELLLTNAIIKHANLINTNNSITKSIDDFSSLVAGSAATRYSGTQTIETTFSNSYNRFVLQDFTRANGIFTYDSQRSTSYATVDFKDLDNNWIEYNNANKDNAALDAHWGAAKTYDFWMTNFNRNSYDNLGTAIKSYVHYRSVASTSLVNAFWNGSVMSYGDGNATVSPLTTIDICGHEIGHAVCSTTADLVYANQSGGLNEGFSDIWGACIEHYARTGSLAGIPNANVWLIAEQLGSSPFRSMSNPLSRGNPDTYLGTNWTATGDEGSCVASSSNDQCGVHSNSGVLNHWFYILTAGKSGTNNAPAPDTYNVTGIGMVKAAQIAYLAERDYLTPNATFLDTRNATIYLASQLYCSNSQEVNSVKNAWFAVNVGDQAVTFATDIAVKSVSQSLNVACGSNYNTTVKVENSGVNTVSQIAISYAIDGGTAITANWNGALSSCQTFDYQLVFPGLSRGTHTVLITINTANDGDSTNNSRTITVLTNDFGTLGQTNTFENTNDNLVSYEDKGTNLLWQRGFAAGATLSNAVANGSKVYGTILNGLYPNATKSYLVSQCYDLSTVANPLLKFDMAFDLEIDYDLLYMQYSTNGGTSWSVLGTSVDTNWYNSNKTPNSVDCQNCVGAQWTGDGNLSNVRGGINADKREYSFNLLNFGLGGSSPQSNIIFRFVFHSDAGLQKEGAIIDNFLVTTAQLLAYQSNQTDNFIILPNPSSGVITVQSEFEGDVNVQLFDSSGRNIFNKIFKNDTSVFNQQIDFGSVQKGIYIITIVSKDKQISKKLIIN